MPYSVTTFPHEKTFGTQHYLAITIKNTKSVWRLMDISADERHFYHGRFKNYDETVNRNNIKINKEPEEIEKIINWIANSIMSGWRFQIDRNSLREWDFFFDKKSDAVLFKLKWS